jgi:hypothetical protein
MSEFSINLPPRLPNAGPAPNILTAVIPDPPRQLAGLDNGTIIKGTVQGRDPDGLLVVATDKGALKLSTPANIPPGTQVTLEVRTAGTVCRCLSSTSRPRRRAVPPPRPTHRQRAGADDLDQSPDPGAAALDSHDSAAGAGRDRRQRAARHDRANRARHAEPTHPVAAACAARRTAGGAGRAARRVAGATAQTPAPPGQPAPSGAQPQADAAPHAPAGQESLPKALVSALQADVRAKIETLFFAMPPAKGAGRHFPHS